jgi:PPOX class probable F420-dependent enzyme
MTIPEKYLDLLTTKLSFANVATVMPDGSPQVTPVWIDYDGTHVVFNTAKGRVKERNLKVGSPVAISISDPDDPYRYLQVRGEVAEIVEPDPGQIDRLAKKYLGVDSYPYRREGEVRITYKIKPNKSQTMG